MPILNDISTMTEALLSRPPDKNVLKSKQLDAPLDTTTTTINKLVQRSIKAKNDYRRRRIAQIRPIPISVLIRRREREKSNASTFVEPEKTETFGPNPATYSPRDIVGHKPEVFFAGKFPKERNTGGRTAWNKIYYSSAHDAFRFKTRYDDHIWPAPGQYNFDKSNVHMKAPAYSITPRRPFLEKDSARNPCPSQYNRQQSDKVCFSRSPTFLIEPRRKTILWKEPTMSTPAPNAYTPNVRRLKTHHPAFTFRISRTEKSHQLGPFAIL